MAIGKRSGIAPPDPFILADYSLAGIFNNPTGRTVRSPVINPALKTLILIVAGQSIWTDILPTLITPANPTVIDHFNIYDGATRDVAGPLLGTSYAAVTTGPGHIAVRVADTLIANGKFDRVIVVPLAVGGTPMFYWGNAGEVYYERTNVAMKRLASRGITPTTPGATFALLWGQGEADGATLQAVYTAQLNGFIAKTVASGFSGRFFICQETWALGTTWAPVRAAQLAACDNVTVFTGGDLDTVNATGRISDNTHPNDAGGASMATIVYNAMHASGAPF